MEFSSPFHEQQTNQNPSDLSLGALKLNFPLQTIPASASPRL